MGTSTRTPSRPPTKMFKARAALAVVGVFALIAACSSQQEVQKAIGCSDPCCAGNATLLDCGESQDLSCVASGDPCTALAYGCVKGMFFQRAQSALPATCAGDAGADAASGDVDTPIGLFGSDDGSDDAETDAVPDAAADAQSARDDGATVDGAPVDAGTDAVTDAQP
jgi:hypothetical protein